MLTINLLCDEAIHPLMGRDRTTEADEHGSDVGEVRPGDGARVDPVGQEDNPQPTGEGFFPKPSKARSTSIQISSAASRFPCPSG